MTDQINMRKVMDELIRSDFHTFVLWAFSLLYPGKTLKDNWHLWLICDHFERLLAGAERRLIVCLPPRHLKSFIASVCFPAFVLGRDPSAKLVCISYGQDISEGFAHQTRLLTETADYRRIFPKTRLDPKRSSKRDLGTTRNGHRRATSVNGALTGMGGDFLIIDDPIKADDALSDVARENVNLWYNSTVTSRLDDPKSGRMAVIAQRLHVDDLPGQLLQAGGWTSLILPLIAQEEERFQLGCKLIRRLPGEILHEEHFGQEEITAIQHTMPSSLFEAQWNQRPTMAGGNIFKLEWLRYDEERVPPSACDYVVQSWDTAIQVHETNDYTVCATFGIRGQTAHLLDIYRARIDHPDQIKMIEQLRAKWDADVVLVEGTHGGIALHQHFQRRYRPCLWLTYITPKGSKEERAEWQTPTVKQGRLHLPRHAEWRLGFEAELTAFPKGKYDDQVDAVVQLLTFLDTAMLRNRIYAARNAR
jgi:predicted phage terminase large subunit-like protein